MLIDSVSDKPSSSLPAGRGRSLIPLGSLGHGSSVVARLPIWLMPESSPSLAAMEMPALPMVFVGN